VLDLIDLVGINQAVIVGGSLGGRVALEIAVARPPVVCALVLVSPSLPGLDWSAEVKAFGDAEDEALDAGDVDVAVELNLKMWFDGPGRPSAAVDPIRRSAAGLMQRRAFEWQMAAGEGSEEELLVADVGARLAEITAPTVVMVGEHDASDFHAIANRVTASVAGAWHIPVPGAAHVPYYERPEVFDPILVEALNDLARRIA
jgi:pimeloyl-ACP methyl ester carboxylesterase